MNKGFFGSLNGILITNPTNIRYLTGFSGVAPEEREAYVLITHDKTMLFTGSLYSEVARQITQAKRLSFVEISKEYPLSAALTDITTQEHIVRLGFEEHNLTVSEYTKYKQVLPLVKLIPTHDRIEVLRMIKRKDEIDNIKLAAQFTDKCFTFLMHRIRPGTTESRLAAEIEGFFRYHGAENAFRPIVAFNAHSSQPHYHTLDTAPLRRGSLILLDFGARVNGYCADMTRVIFFGAPQKEWIHTYETVLAANNKALELLRDGQRNGATLDAAAREVIAEAGLPVYPHSLGHAVGLDIHEAPRLTVQKEALLQPYMVVTIEPGVYIEGSYGIRIEDLVLIENDRIDVLSGSLKNALIL